jgi:hypothetical protein
MVFPVCDLSSSQLPKLPRHGTSNDVAISQVWIDPGATNGLFTFGDFFKGVLFQARR